MGRVLGIIITVAAFVAAPGSAAGAGGDALPLRLNSSAVVTGRVCVPTAPQVMVCTTTSRGTMTGTYVGRGTSELTSTQIVTLGACAGGSGFTVSSSHVGTITAANGDELFWVGTTTACFVAGAGTSIGTIAITGGTGRFAGVSGSGTLIATTVADAISATITGTIDMR